MISEPSKNLRRFRLFSRLAKRTSRLFFRHLAIVFLVWLIGAFPTLVFALPEDGQIVSGSGIITEPTATSMQIDQFTGQMIINWDAFNIGGSESVNFSQPDAGSIALNRVIGADPSLLLGNLTANGQVFISNGSGVFFGPGSKVDTHGLIATTMGISDQDFLDQNYNFSQDLDNPLSSVINEGTISATSYVGLLAPAVDNRGTIVASLGSVDLAAGKAATLDFTGDGLISFEVTEAVAGTVTDKDGNVLQDRVSNSGLIQADGGQVRMTAKDAGDVIRHVVNMEGTIQANTVVEQEGRIFLTGGSSGVVNVSGTITAEGNDTGEKGGTVHVLGEKVGLFANAVVDVFGDAGGGEALIGGDYQGKNAEIQNAFRTYVGEDAVISASAGTSGDGGKVIVWADEVTRFYGSVLATGGSLSGDGGFVEVSGKGSLNFHAHQIALGSVNGIDGTLLLDPLNITISSSADSNTAGFTAGSDDTEAFADDSGLTSNFDVTASTGSFNGVTGTIELQATNDITVSAAWNLATSTGNSNVSVVLRAGNDININQAITLDGTGTLTLEADGNTANGAGDLVFGASGSLITANQAISITAFDLNLTSGTIDAGTGDVTILTSFGGNIGVGDDAFSGVAMQVDETELGNITANNLNIGDSSTTGNLIVDAASSFTNISSLNLTTTSAGTVTFEAGTLNTGSANLTVSSGGDITQNGTVTVGGNASFTSGTGSITLNDTGNDLGANLTVDTNNSFDMFTTSTLTDLTITLDATGNPTYAITATGLTFTATTSLGNISAFAMTSSSALNFNLTMDAGSLASSGAVDVGTGSFAITTNDSTDGSITFSTTLDAGSLTLDANGTNTDISITASATIASGGAVSLTADDTVNFGAAGSITASGAGNVFLQSNANSADGDGSDQIIMADGASIDAGSGTITLTSTGANSGNITVGELTTTNSTSSAVILTSDLAIVDAGATGTNIIATTGTVTLTGATGIGSGDAIETNTAVLVLDSNQSIQIANSTTNLTDLTLTLDPGSTVDTYSITDGNMTLTLADSGADTDIGGLTLSAGNLNFSLNTDTGAITTSGAMNVGTGSFALTNNDTGTGSAITLSNTLAAGSLTVNANGQFSDINLSAAITITTGAVTLTADDAVNINSGGSITANGTGNVSLTANNVTTDGNSFDVIQMSSGTSIDAGSGTITLTAVGVNASNNTLRQLTTTNSSSSALVINALGNVALNDTVSVTGDMSVTSSGNISQTATLTIGGASSFDTSASTGTITLTQANAFTGAVTLSSGTGAAQLTDSTDTILAASTLGGNLTVTSSGAITQTGALSVTGTSSFTVSSANAMTLTNTSNSFTGAVTLSSGTGAVQLTDSSDTILAASTLSGNLTVTSSGAITQTGVLSVAGTSSFTVSGSNAMTLTQANTFTGAVTLSSGTGAVQITDSSTLILAASTLGGDLTASADNGLTINGDLTTTGNMTLDGDLDNISTGTLTIASGVTLTANSGGAITLDATTGGIIASGAITLKAVNGITINDDFTGSGAMTLNSDSDSDGTGDLTLANNVDIDSSGNSIEITQADTSVGSSVTVNAGSAGITSNFTKAVTVDGADASIITAAGSLTTTSTGNITVDGVTSAELTNISGTYSLISSGTSHFKPRLPPITGR